MIEHVTRILLLPKWEERHSCKRSQTHTRTLPRSITAILTRTFVAPDASFLSSPSLGALFFPFLLGASFPLVDLVFLLGVSLPLVGLFTPLPPFPLLGDGAEETEGALEGLTLGEEDVLGIFEADGVLLGTVEVDGNSDTLGACEVLGTVLGSAEADGA